MLFSQGGLTPESNSTRAGERFFADSRRRSSKGRFSVKLSTTLMLMS